MALTMLAAVLEQAGHRVHLLDANAAARRRSTDEIVDEATRIRPDIIGVTLLTPLVKEAYRLASSLRTCGAKLIAGGHLRVNANKVHKPAQAVGAGDVLTFPQGRRIRVIKVLALGERRGPAPEAQALYEDLSPADDTPPANPRFEGKGRPSGKDRRNARLFDPFQLE